MKVIGIIAEFNPLHKGHEYFLKEARKRAGADFVVVLMSGNYVQRGEPAIWNKYIRAGSALLAGADLVLELPLAFSTGSASIFAEGGVSILEKLRIIDELWFGSEAGTIDPFLKTARILSEEPDIFSRRLKDELRSGKTFPQARAAALNETMQADLNGFLSAPNNILGLEYCLALQKQNSAIRPCTLPRTGSGYHDHNPDPAEACCCAEAIRHALYEKKTELLSSAFPDFFYSDFDCNDLYGHFLTPDDFSLPLRYCLLSHSTESLSQFQDVSGDLAARIKNTENRFRSFSQFAMLLKSRNYTYTRISRALLHILLGLTDADLEDTRNADAVRLLAVGSCRPLLHAIGKRSAIRLWSGRAEAASHAESRSRNRELFASNLYEAVLADKTGATFVHEYSRKLIVEKN